MYVSQIQIPFFSGTVVTVSEIYSYKTIKICLPVSNTYKICPEEGQEIKLLVDIYYGIINHLYKYRYL